MGRRWEGGKKYWTLSVNIHALLGGEGQSTGVHEVEMGGRRGPSKHPAG